MTKSLFTLFPGTNASCLHGIEEQSFVFGVNFMEHYKNLSLENIVEFIEGVGLVTEEWKDICFKERGEFHDYSNMYQVSNLGRVKSLKRKFKTPFLNFPFRYTVEMIRKLSKDKIGYLSIPLSKDGIPHSFLVSRLVAHHFIDNPFNLPETNHKKGVKTDNRYFELEWSSKIQNIRHAFKTGLNKNIGSNHTSSKLNENEVIEIFKSKDIAKILAKKYKVNITTIYSIKNGRQWSRVTGKIWDYNKEEKWKLM